MKRTVNRRLDDIEARLRPVGVESFTLYLDAPDGWTAAQVAEENAKSARKGALVGVRMPGEPAPAGCRTVGGINWEDV